MDAFQAPKEVSRPEVVLTSEDQRWLDYVHGTIGPKLVLAVALVGVALLVIVPSLFSLLDGAPDLIWVMRVGLYLVIGLVGLISAAAAVQALRLHKERLDLVVEALDTEVLFWQTAVLAIALCYTSFGVGFMYVLFFSPAR